MTRQGFRRSKYRFSPSAISSRRRPISPPIQCERLRTGGRALGTLESFPFLSSDTLQDTTATAQFAKPLILITMGDSELDSLTSCQLARRSQTWSKLSQVLDK